MINLNEGTDPPEYRLAIIPDLLAATTPHAARAMQLLHSPVLKQDDNLSNYHTPAYGNINQRVQDGIGAHGQHSRVGPALQHPASSQHTESNAPGLCPCSTLHTPGPSRTP